MSSTYNIISRLSKKPHFVFARSEATKQSSEYLHSGLLRFARKDGNRPFWDSLFAVAPVYRFFYNNDNPSGLSNGNVIEYQYKKSLRDAIFIAKQHIEPRTERRRRDIVILLHDIYFASLKKINTL
jgi:hypothetical protein